MKLFSRVRSGVLSLLVAATFLLAPYGAPAPESAVAAPRTGTPGKIVLRMAVKTGIVNMDHMRDGTTTNNAVLRQVVEPLLLQSEKGEILPNLALSWGVSKQDSTLWTVRLRRGVKFHDGSPFNAQAVVASFGRLKDPNFKLTRGVQFFGPLVSVRAVDDMTVQFRTKAPWAVFPVYLAYTGSAILAPALARKERISVPIGTGPFKFAEWRRGEFVRLVKNDDYWGEGPFVDEVIVYEVPEDGVRIAKLLAGEVDLITDVPPQEAERLSKVSGIVLRKDPSDRTMWLQFNTKRAPFDDRNVRTAVKYAIDVNAITRGIMKGTAFPANSVVAPGVFGVWRDPNYQEYNPSKARELLAAARYPNGFSTTIMYGFYDPLHKEVLTAIQAQLAEVGIRVRIEGSEFATYYDALVKPLAENRMQMHSWSWSAVVGDISFVLSSLFLPEGRFPPDCCNVMFWSNRTVGELFQASQREVNVTKRLELLKRIQEVINREVPSISLFVFQQLTAQNAKLEGVVMPPNQEFRLGRARFNR